MTITDVRTSTPRHVPARGPDRCDDLGTRRRAARWASSSPVVGGFVYGEATVVLPRAPGLGTAGLA
ncbi:MAG: hypothetical protein ACRDPG_00415 [Nocardioidaceae bacterium]